MGEGSDQVEFAQRLGRDPYGVPTGVVPRVVNSIPPATGYATTPHVNLGEIVQRWQRTPGALVHPDLAKAVAEKAAGIRADLEAANLPPDNATVGVFDASAPGSFRPTDPIAQAVDDYLLMERKARAWDELRARGEKAQWQTLLVQMDRLVHPAQEPSTR